MSIRIRYRGPHDVPRTEQERSRVLACVGQLRAQDIPAVPYEGSVYAQCGRSAWLAATMELAWLRAGAVVYDEERE